jgi:hypothetical protein
VQLIGHFDCFDTVGGSLDHTAVGGLMIPVEGELLRDRP